MNPDPDEEPLRPGLRLDRRHARRLLAFARPHLGLFVLSFLVLAALFGLDLLGPWLVRRLIDGPLRAALAGRPPEGLALLGGAFVLTAALKFAGNIQEIRLTTLAGQRVVLDLRAALFRHVLHLSPDYFDRTAVGRLVTRISSDCENLSELFTTGLVVTLVDLLKIAGFFGACLWISPRLTLLLLAASPVLIGVTVLFQRRAKAAYRDVRTRISTQTAWFAEAMQGVRITRLFGREDFVQARFDELNRSTRDGWLRTILLFGLFFSFVDFGTGTVQAGILWTAGPEIAGRHLDWGAFMQFWLYFGYMLGPIRELGEKYNIMQSAFASAEKIFQVLDERPSLPEKPGARKPPPDRADVRFEGVDFAYRPGRPVLSGIDFAAPDGSLTAIVGPTGAGKTTLIQLLARFRDPTAGRILVGGVDLRDLDLRAHRSRIGIVLQDVFLFAADILENVRLFDPAISEERVVRALETVQALDLVERAGGLHAKVGERGATFSQGERQLLAFARALCRDPQILVLDEATANIDTETERRIQQAMAAVVRGRTTFVIAHRLSTVRHADRILVIDGGRIVERGSHDELLARGGLYAKLARTLG